MVINQTPSNSCILLGFFILFLDPFGVLALLAEAEAGTRALVLASDFRHRVAVALLALDYPAVLL